MTSNENLYLILHLVRGQPAFDIAVRCEAKDGWGTGSDPAPWWIIPTSGRRAYPYDFWPMTQLWYNRDFVPTLVEAPAGTPDHYPQPLALEPRPLLRRQVSAPPKATPSDIDALIG